MRQVDDRQPRVEDEGVAGVEQELMVTALRFESVMQEMLMPRREEVVDDCLALVGSRSVPANSAKDLSSRCLRGRRARKVVEAILSERRGGASPKSANSGHGVCSEERRERPLSKDTCLSIRKLCEVVVVVWTAD